MFECHRRTPSIDRCSANNVVTEHHFSHYVEAIDAHKIPAGIELITERYQEVPLRSTQVLVECNHLTSGRRAKSFQATIPHDYRMHVQREFPISSATSDPEVHRAGRAHAAAATLIEAIAPPCRARIAKEPRMKLSRTVGLAVAVS